MLKMHKEEGKTDGSPWTQKVTAHQTHFHQRDIYVFWLRARSSYEYTISQSLLFDETSVNLHRVYLIVLVYNARRLCILNHYLFWRWIIFPKVWFKLKQKEENASSCFQTAVKCMPTEPICTRGTGGQFIVQIPLSVTCFYVVPTKSHSDPPTHKGISAV